MKNAPHSHPGRASWAFATVALTGVSCGGLLASEQLGWSLIGLAVGGVIGGAMTPRRRLATPLVEAGFACATAAVVWFGPWAWHGFTSTAIATLPLQAGLIMVLFVAVLLAATAGFILGQVLRSGVSARSTSPFASAAGAIAWFFGLVLVSEASILPSDSAYLWFGGNLAALGVAVFPVAAALPHDRLSRGLGAAVAIALIGTGLAMILVGNGAFGQTLPTWADPTSGAALIAFVLWTALTSYIGRREDRLGTVVLILGGVNVLALLVAVAVLVVPHTHTNATTGIDGLVALLLLTAVPAWFLALSVRLWRPRPTA